MKRPKQKIQYIYIKPKNEAEAREAQRRLDRAFDILFDEVDKKYPLSKVRRLGR